MEINEPVKNQRSVLSVSFNRLEFAHVVQAAKKLGMKTSEFVRDAAVARATNEDRKALLSSLTESKSLDVLIARPQVTESLMRITMEERPGQAVTSPMG